MEQSSQLRGQDLVRWLGNRFGDSNEWKANIASSVLTSEILSELETCFQELDSPVKLKMIQALVYLPRKIIEQWKIPIVNLIELGRRDAEDWVETIADMFRDFPDNTCIRLTSHNDNSFLNKSITELNDILANFTEHFSQVLPRYSLYGSHSSNMAKYGFAENSVVTHFTRKSSTKFDSLLSDVKKATEHHSKQSAYKKNGQPSSIPIKMRSSAKKANDMPIKGIPMSSSKTPNGFSQDQSKFPKRSLAKREGGAVLLELADIPDPKRRRRAAALEYPTPNEANQLRGKTSQNTDKNDLPTSSDDLDIQNEPDAFDNNNTMNSVDQFDLADQTNNNTNDSQDANKMPDLSYVHLKSFAPLFKEANKLTPETFNIILRFLGGNRENPYGEKRGHVISLPLSEVQEEVYSNGFKATYNIETCFQMDFQTSEWKRMKKSKLVTSQPAPDDSSNDTSSNKC